MIPEIVFSPDLPGLLEYAHLSVGPRMALLPLRDVLTAGTVLHWESDSTPPKTVIWLKKLAYSTLGIPGLFSGKGSWDGHYSSVLKNCYFNMTCLAASPSWRGNSWVWDLTVAWKTENACIWESRLRLEDTSGFLRSQLNTPQGYFGSYESRLVACLCLLNSSQPRTSQQMLDCLCVGVD